MLHGWVVQLKSKFELMGDIVCVRYSNVDISIAVSTGEGLITPIVFNADKIGLLEVSNEVKRLAGKAKAQTLAPSEFMVLIFIGSLDLGRYIYHIKFGDVRHRIIYINHQPTTGSNFIRRNHRDCLEVNSTT